MATRKPAISIMMDESKWRAEEDMRTLTRAKRLNQIDHAWQQLNGCGTEDKRNAICCG